jgi:hypothetical protein
MPLAHAPAHTQAQKEHTTRGNAHVPRPLPRTPHLGNLDADEKTAIARSYLEPQARADAGVPPGAVQASAAPGAPLLGSARPRPRGPPPKLSAPTPAPYPPPFPFLSAHAPFLSPSYPRGRSPTARWASCSTSTAFDCRPPPRPPSLHPQVTDGAMGVLIDQYCREAGVRNLKKHLEKVYRKAALKLVQARCRWARGVFLGRSRVNGPAVRFHPQRPLKLEQARGQNPVMGLGVQGPGFGGRGLGVQGLRRCTARPRSSSCRRAPFCGVQG